MPHTALVVFTARPMDNADFLTHAIGVFDDMTAKGHHVTTRTYRLERTPASVLDLPFDLVRHDLLMGLEPPEPERIRAVVDELFLPLVTAYLTE